MLRAVSRASTPKSHHHDIATRVVRRDVNLTRTQDEALKREAAALGIGRNELLRRVLDEWCERLPKKGSP